MITLGLILTYRCNAFCKMCCNDSGPGRSEDMSLIDAFHFLDQAFHCGIRNIGITGGEPFLFFSKLKKIAQYCKNRNMYLSILTNAYWAEDLSNSRAKLIDLKGSGLSKLSISTSEYHEEFVPLDRVKNCINAALECDLKLEIRVLVGTNTKKLKYYTDRLKLVPNENLVIREHNISKVGRGSIIEADQFIKSAEDRGCNSIFNIPVVEPNGDIYACCGVAYKSKPLLLGNLKRETLSDLLKKAYLNPLYLAISKFGVYSLTNMMLEDGYILDASKYTDMCHLCHTLLNNTNFGQLTKTINKRSIQIQVSSAIIDELKKNHK